MMDSGNDANDVESSEGDSVDHWEEDSDGEESDDNGDDDRTSDDGDNDGVEVEIMEKLMRTFHNGNYDAELDNALSWDRGVTLQPVNPAQASYNKPDNWRERNRIGLDSVKGQLQGLFNEVSQEFGWISLIHGPQLIDNEEPIVWHEPNLDEYWEQFEAEIGRRHLDGVTTYIEGIEIENVEIKKEHLSKLVAIFCSGRATSSCDGIKFDNANLCEVGIVLLSKLVNVNANAELKIKIKHNRINNLHSACCLSRALKLNPRIDELHLTHCDLGSSPEILSLILKSDVEYINLDYNNIDSSGAVKIAEYLEGNPPIKYLSLARNLLNDEDAVLISHALKRNTNLHRIYLHLNNMTCIGVKALLTCVFDASTLIAISESNHTLRGIKFFVQENEISSCIDLFLDFFRTEKIWFALQDKDSLLQYLANVPVDLIPEVLIFSQQHGCQLNAVYSTMRWCNMPMLYSYCCCVKSVTKRKRSNK
jgi:hypothetical protein